MGRAQDFKRAPLSPFWRRWGILLSLLAKEGRGKGLPGNDGCEKRKRRRRRRRKKRFAAGQEKKGLSHHNIQSAGLNKNNLIFPA